MGFRVQVLGFIDLVVARLGSRNQSLERGAIGNDLDFVFFAAWFREFCRRRVGLGIARVVGATGSWR